MQLTQLGIQNTFPSRVRASDFVFVIMDMGQSNAIGRAESDRLALTTYPEKPAKVNIYFKPDYTTTLNGAFQAYQAGVNTEEPDQSSTLRMFSHSLALGAKLRDYTGNSTYIIPAGDGGTALEQNLTSPDWSPASVGECFQIFMQRYYNVAMATVLALHPTKQVKVVILWSQGETDATDGTATTDYATNFDNFYSSVRGLAITYQSYIQAAPWIVSSLNYLQTANETTINGVFDSFAAGTGLGNLFVVDMSAQPRKVDLTTGEKGGFTPTASDDEHLSYIAQNYFGAQAFEIVKTFFGLTSADPSEYLTNTQFDPSTITASGIRVQFSRNENTIDSDNKITNANNSLTSTDFTTVATAQHAPRFKVDKLRGAIWFSPLATVHRVESDAAIGTSLFAGSWSFGAWVKPRTATSGDVRIIVHDIQNVASPNNSRMFISINASGQIYGAIGVGGTIVQYRSLAAVWSGTLGNDITDWKHIAVTATSGDFVRVYVDSVLEPMDTTPGFTGDISGLTLANYVNATNKLQIGARRQAASNYDQFYYGMLREVIIQPGVVYSTSDIANLMLN